MYYIKDVYMDRIVATCGAEADVIAWLKPRALPLSINEAVNVTGMDKYLRHDAPADSFRMIPMLSPSGREMSIVRYRPEAYALRPYQVLDEDGHPVDPRAWPSVPATKNSYGQVCSTGSRPHGHRISGPSMHRQTLRAIAGEMTDSELYDLGLCAAAKVHTSVRRKVAMGRVDAIDFPERKWASKYRSSKCWKDQHKTLRQWGKHKRGFNTPMLPPCECGEDLLMRLSSDGFPVAALS